MPLVHYASMISTAKALAITRIAIGFYFLSQAFDKTRGGWLADGAPMVRIIEVASRNTEPFYRPFLEGTVLPNATVFAQIVTIGEWGAGISLALGLLTRVGSVAVLLMVIHYMLMKGLANNIGSIDRAFAAAAVAFFLASAGMTWGLDGVLYHGLRQSGAGRLLLGRPTR